MAPNGEPIFPEGAPLSTFYLTNVAELAITKNDANMSLISGTVPSLGYGSPQVYCKLNVSRDAILELPTDADSNRSSKMSFNGKPTSLITSPPPFVTNYMNSSKMIIGSQPTARGVTLKLNALQVSGITSLRLRFPRYVVFPSFDETNLTINQDVPCQVKFLGDTPFTADVIFNLSGRIDAKDSIILSAEFPQPWKLGDSVTVLRLTIPLRCRWVGIK